MITPKQIELEAMPPEKRESAKNDYFAFYVGRPITYWLTVPFLYTSLTPNTITIISIIPLIIGFFLSYFATTITMFVVVWCLFFLWALLDGVDGNVARYRKQFSKLGSVYDALGGYIAMVLAPFACGIMAAHNPGYFNLLVPIPLDIYTVLGALSGICLILPRLIMHKMINTIGQDSNAASMAQKNNFGFIKLLALNLTSITGFAQLLMLIAAITNILDIYTVFYFLINFSAMLMSLFSMFRNS